MSPSTARSEIYAIHADERLSALLGIRLDKSLLHLVETYYTGEGQPIALSLNHFLTDRSNFYINGRVLGRPRRIESSAHVPQIPAKGDQARRSTTSERRCSATRGLSARAVGWEDSIGGLSIGRVPHAGLAQNTQHHRRLALAIGQQQKGEEKNKWVIKGILECTWV